MERRPTALLAPVITSKPAGNSLDRTVLPASRARAGFPEPAHEAGGASIGEIVGAGLHNIQDTYGLQQDNAALPGTDPARQDRLKAFHRNDAAMPPEELDAVIKSVDPNGTEPDHNGLALNMLYNFYAQKGDTATAAKAAGSFLGAARQRSMEYGQDAVNSLQRRDAQGASKALVAAYNEVPDGNEVTAQVNQQGVGKAVVNDVATGKVVHELPINPQVLAAVAQKFATGDEFYTQLTRVAAPGLKSKPALRAVVGGPVTRLSSDALPGDDEEPDYEEDDEGSDEDATVQQAGYDSPEGGSDAGVGQQGAIPTKGAQFSDAPPIIPYLPNMTADQRRYLDNVNRRRESDWREKQLHERAKQLNADVVDRTAKRTEEAAKKEHNRNLRIEGEKRYTEERKDHNDRYRNDPEYRAAFELQGINNKAAANAYFKSGPETDNTRRLLDEDRLAAAVRGKVREKYINEDFKARIQPYEEALQGVVGEGDENKKNGKVDERLLPDLYKPEFKNQKNAFLDLVDRVAAKNNVAPNTIVRSLFDVTQMVNPQNSMAINKDGRVQIGRERVFMDRDDFRMAAGIRGDNLDTWRKNAEEQKKMNKETEGKRQVGVATRRQTIDDIDAAGGGIGVDAARPAPQRASGARGKYYMRRHAEELGVGSE